ncbi:MAG: RimK/LysX family protein [Nanoarchaeota archaeon]|nr:RimK/LysX family protein [Nanoarchaeota archaeon]
MEKNIVGLTEKVKIKDIEVLAKIDTGATKSSIDIRLAARLQLGPIIATKQYKNVHGKTVRPVVKVPLEISKRRMFFKFNLADRKKMKYKILIGQNILKKNFIIDPSKK